MNRESVRGVSWIRGLLSGKRCVFALLAVMLGLAGNVAHATCTVLAPGLINTQLTIPSLNTVARNAPVGTILWDSGWQQTASTAQVQCDQGAQLVIGYTSSMTQSSLPYLYQTSIPGVGIRAGFSYSTDSNCWDPLESLAGQFGGTNGCAWLLQPSPGTQPGFAAPIGIAPVANNYRVELVVIGPLQSGNYAAAFPSPTATAQFGTTIVSEVTFSNTTVSIQTLGCQVQNNGIVMVPLPTISTSALPTVGATATPTAFQIPLLCDSGVKVSYELDGTLDPAVNPAYGVLANQVGSGYATGVGVQLLQGTTSLAPVLLNQPPSAVYITTTSNNQPVNIPFVARYYRTSGTMTPGQVHATATIYMTYQ
jgi:type 1 fimbria pilin